ncbi:MAG: type IV secretory system conjugative DNA transfer family protein [Chloroflexi bacterium]|nr:type IV secretory system conjugative DNA transfer family protein [Chloroflexota bacterium]
MMRNIIGQSKSGFNFKDVMNNEKILIVNLSKGQIGEVNSNLLGLIIVSKLQMAAMARADMPESERKNFYLYIDEFQNYTTDSIATILSEARKYKLNLIMAHQYLGQLVQQNDTKILDAVLGNVGTMISFRIGSEDTETMERQFAPVFNAYDLINVDKYHAFMRTLVANAATRPFNIETASPKAGARENFQRIKELSRMTHGRAKSEVEDEIAKRSKLGLVGSPTQPPPPPSK